MAPSNSRTHSFTCPTCQQTCLTYRGLLRHIDSAHRPPEAPENDIDENDSYYYQHHPDLNDTPPPPPPAVEEENSWDPFDSRADFNFAWFHFMKEQTSEAGINTALDIWAASLLPFGADTPWKNADELYSTIDVIQLGDAPWKTVKVRYTGPLPAGQPPKWMTETYEFCFRNTRQVLHQQLASPNFKSKTHYVPYRQFNPQKRRVYSNLMSGDWAWKQADIIAKDPATHGAFFLPVVSGSDKTTVSVGTGHQEYHPVYMSPGNITNSARRAHGNGVLPVAFLPIPKALPARRKHRDSRDYQRFTRQLYHSCLARLFQPLKAGMTVPEIVQCADGYSRRVIYGLGPYIADYPEQVWLASVVQNWCPKCMAHPGRLDAEHARRRTQEMTDLYIASFDAAVVWKDFGIRSDVTPFTNEFPHADIHKLLSPDLLHQVIKGTFKDHIVSWVNDYLYITEGEARAKAIIDDIDQRISAVPSFPGLRRFPAGRDFHQWTGDDSKALMKVYLTAITGHVPDDMVRCLAAFLDFCYLVRRNAITADTLDQTSDALARFHLYREVFVHAGVRPDGISLPRQHSLKHYIHSIRLFGSPNGLCSSITESKHIKAVKEPWRRSSRFAALSQMLRTNRRIDKMTAAHYAFQAKGMLAGTALSYTAMILDGGAPEPPPEIEDEDEDDYGAVIGPRVMSSVDLVATAERNYPKEIHALAIHINQPRLPELVRRFLYDQVNDDPATLGSEVALDDCPSYNGNIRVFHSAIARFYAPSELCGAGGMHREHIRSTPLWRGLYSRRDTVFVETDGEQDGMLGMAIGRVHLFFSLSHEGTYYPCALVQWLVPVGDTPDDVTGLWVVKRELDGLRRPHLAVVHLDCIPRAAHLLPNYGSNFIPETLQFHQSLDAFQSYFINTYADHHMHEFLS
ncbi:hypothetical protein HWV62_2942 [Athelia sp. TMB]|nr:hypothetical protein HWV62_2942 [Athelia sp. TMB]